MSQGRRLYLYGVALFGLVVSLVGLISFLWRFAGEQAAAFLGATPLSGALASPALPWLVVFVLALATWLFHIIMANQAARPLTMAGADERAAPERKMYLYMGRLAVVAALAGQIGLLIREVVRAFLDHGAAGLIAGSAWPAGLAVGALAALVYYIYLRIEAARDGDLGQERGGAVLWRRAYTYVAALAGAVLAFGGGGELVRVGIRVLMTPLSGDVTWHRPAATAAAALIVGLALGAAAWGAANRAASMNPLSETNALSRVLLRYDGILIATLVTLVALGYLIEQIILRAISRPAAVGGPLFGLFDWPWALAYLPAAALTWISFSNAVRTDALWGGERPSTAAIRRIIRYLLTAASLAAFWYGLTEFARLILQVFLGADTATASAAEWVQRFATSAAFLLVGAPAWWGHWWSQQIRVRNETHELGLVRVGDVTPGETGERASRTRRIYLVAVIVVGAVIVVAASGFALFLALNWQAAGELGGVRAAVAGAGAAALVALFWTLVHGLTLRGDLRFLARQWAEGQPAIAVAAPMAPPFAPVSVRGNGPEATVPVIAATRMEATAPRLAPVGPSSVVRVFPGAPNATGEGSAQDEIRQEELATESRAYRREDLAPLAAQVGLNAGEGYRPPYALAVIDGGDGLIGARLLAALHSAYRDAVLWPCGLNEVAHRAMAAALSSEELAPMPEDAFEQVAAVLAPSDALIPGALDGQVTPGLVQSLARTSAHIILLPPRDARLKWVAAPRWPLERWIENAVIEAGNALNAQ